MKTRIVQKENTEEVPAEIIAQSVVEIAQAMKVISATRLARKAIVALVHDQSKISKTTINLVLNNLEDLEKDWLKPKLH